jgi:hypothetical protein
MIFGIMISHAPYNPVTYAMIDRKTPSDILDAGEAGDRWRQQRFCSQGCRSATVIAAQPQYASATEFSRVAATQQRAMGAVDDR